METEEKKELSPQDYLERNKNATSRYMEDSRKQYLLASNTESLQTLMERQQEELTRVLIELKSEYDLLTRETSIKKQLIDEYNKKINMIQHANTVNEKRQEEKKESTNHIKEGIELKDGTVFRAAKLDIDPQDPHAACITISEGKYHQIKRMLLSRGKEVIYLKRLSVGALELDENLPEGAYRELTEDELKILHKKKSNAL